MRKEQCEGGRGSDQPQMLQLLCICGTRRLNGLDRANECELGFLLLLFGKAPNNPLDFPPKERRGLWHQLLFWAVQVQHGSYRVACFLCLLFFAKADIVVT